MSENNIKKAIDSVEPSSGAKERMYRNIIKKAQQAAPTQMPAEPAKEKQTKKKTVPFVRYVLPIAACFCLLIIGVVTFFPGSTPTQPDISLVEGGNPFVEVENADAFKALSITLDAPEGAQEVFYAIIDGKIAEIQFVMNGKSYHARASAQEGDFSGLNGEESGAEAVDAKTNATLVNVTVNSEIYRKINWTNGKINYCLYGTDGADKDQILSVYKALKK